MNPSKLLVSILIILPVTFAVAQNNGDTHDHNMIIKYTGVVANENYDALPNGCEEISSERQISVYTNKRFADGVPGAIFGMNEYEWHLEPCSRVTVTLINEDTIRHQWMIHGLPKYLYPAGMFHIEAMGGQSQTGTFIAPSENQNYLVHCDMAQHMEMGMRGQIIVGKGSGDLWSVTGITNHFYRASYLPRYIIYLCLIVAVIGYLLYSKLVPINRKG